MQNAPPAPTPLHHPPPTPLRHPPPTPLTTPHPPAHSCTLHSLLAPRFLQENDAKRARADKKAADEVKARLAKEVEIEQLAEVLEGLRAEREQVHEVLVRSTR